MEMEAMFKLMFCLFTSVILLQQPVRASEISPLASPALDSALGNCPLNVSYLSSHPWIVQKCKQGKHCCEAVNDLMRILLFSWMHHTHSFLLADVRTSQACMDAIQRHMEQQGVIENVFQMCHIQPADFVNGPQHCHRVENRSTFEKLVNESDIKSFCDSNASRFVCHACIRAMVRGLRLLTAGGREKNNCELFMIVFVGGDINAYEELGPDAAYCILGAQNLSELTRMVEGSNSGAIDHSKLKKLKTKIVVSLGILFPAVAIMALIVVCVKRRELFGGGFERLVLSRRESQLLRESVDLTTGLLFFRYSDLRESTGNFSASNVIGKGGFGTVFRGTLPDGSQIAVKRFNDSTTKGDEVFKHEVHVISSVKHRNLLPLRGYCIGKSEKHQHFLVYDYMSNGSLADYLFRRGSRPPLTWHQRYKIAVGIARGLAYLHGDAKPAIIHRDIKPANVLLDADLNALVADFGLARFKEEDCSKTHYTTSAVGTLGYVAPEYALYGHLTDKGDVYGFGIVLLELMSGRRALDPTDQDNVPISDWASELARKGRVEEAIEEGIREEEGESKESMERVVLLALQCAHTRAACRPSINEVLFLLESLDRPPTPHPPPLRDMTSSSSGGSSSYNSKYRQWDWVVSAEEIESGRMSYRSGSVAAGSVISTDSYQTGR